jgi:predicted PurR-regulated permease PerM
MEQEIFKKVSIFVVLGFLVALSVLILWPIASAIVIGLILSYIFFPVYKKIHSFVKNENLSAAIVILLVIFLILIPLWVLLPVIVKQIFDIYLYLQKINIIETLRSIFPSLTQTEFSVDFATSFNNFISNMASGILTTLSKFILDLPNLLLKSAVVLFVFFFGMRDAEIFVNYAKSLSPFSKSAEEELSDKFKGITNSVIYGFFVVGILQGILTGIGLFIFGVPQALLLTLLAVMVSIIPILGSWLIWAPASIYLFISGKIFFGIALVIYGAIIISWIDNIIRPYIVARRVKISSAVILVGMIGGLLVFGILGFIMGPLILSYLLLILDAYRRKKVPGLFSRD